MRVPRGLVPIPASFSVEGFVTDETMKGHAVGGRGGPALSVRSCCVVLELGVALCENCFLQGILQQENGM